MKNPDTSIRFETIQTRKDLQALHEVLSTVFETQHEGFPIVPNTRMTEPSLCALGAWHDKELVAGLVAYELPLLNGTKEMYIYDIGVLPSYHKQGIGTGLIDALKNEAKKRGVSTLFVEAEDDDDGAVAFYRSLACEEVGVRHFNIDVL